MLCLQPEREWTWSGLSESSGAGWLLVGRGPCPAHTAAFTPQKERRKWESTWSVGGWGGPL